MSDAIKILGQSAPAATILTDLYTVPSSATTTISSFFAANRTTSGATFRASVAVSGAVDSSKQYLYFDTDLPANETFVATVGITLSQTDVFRVYASLSGISFNLFGAEIS